MTETKLTSAPSSWRGQVVLDIDIEAGSDDAAMEALEAFVTPILSKSCSISKRSVVLRRFFGHDDAPWQKQEMTTNGNQLIDRAIEVATLTEGGEWADASKPDLHIHRDVLEETIDHALRRNYREGMRIGQAKYRPDLNRVISEAASPDNVATVLRDFAAKYDDKGWTDEANLLRDAATQVEDVPSDLK